MHAPAHTTLRRAQTGLTSGKTLEVKIIAANETAPTDTVSVVVG